MGQVFEGCAGTTEAVRRTMRHRQKCLNALAEPYGINPKTAAKWKKRALANDAPMRPKEGCATGPTSAEEAAIVAFRKYPLLPLDACPGALKPTIPHLTRSSLQRCLQLHGISRLPEVEGDKPKKQTFASYPMGYFPIAIAEVHRRAARRIAKHFFSHMIVSSSSCMRSSWPTISPTAAIPSKV